MNEEGHARWVCVLPAAAAVAVAPRFINQGSGERIMGSDSQQQVTKFWRILGFERQRTRMGEGREN